MKLAHGLHLCRVALVNRPRFKVACCGATHGKHAVRVASHAWSYTRASANPHSVFQGDFADHQVEGGFLVIVIAAEKQSALGDAAVVTKGHLSEVVDPHFFADPSVVANGKLPRIFDLHARLDDHSNANLSAKQFKNVTFQRIRPRKPCEEEKARKNEPKNPFYNRSSIIMLVAKGIQPCSCFSLMVMLTCSHEGNPGKALVDLESGPSFQNHFALKHLAQESLDRDLKNMNKRIQNV